MTLRRLLAAATLSAALGAAAAVPSAQAAKQCAPVTGKSELGSSGAPRTLSAQVEVFAGRVTCATARRVAKVAVFGHPRYVDHGGADHYLVVGRWKGQVRMGFWNFRNGSRIIDGKIFLVCPDGRKLPIDPPPTC